MSCCENTISSQSKYFSCLIFMGSTVFTINYTLFEAALRPIKVGQRYSRHVFLSFILRESRPCFSGWPAKLVCCQMK